MRSSDDFGIKQVAELICGSVFVAVAMLMWACCSHPDYFVGGFSILGAVLVLDSFNIW